MEIDNNNTTQNDLMVVAQVKNNSNSDIVVSRLTWNSLSILKEHNTTIYNEQFNIPYSTNLSPVIGMVNVDFFMIAFVSDVGQIWAAVGRLWNNYTVQWHHQYNILYLLSSSNKLLNPTIFSTKPILGQSQLENYSCWFAFEEKISLRNSRVFAAKIFLGTNTIGGAYQLEYSEAGYVSDASGFSLNTMPSIVAFGENAKIVWIGGRQNTAEGVLEEENGELDGYGLSETKVVLKDIGVEGFRQYGSNVGSPSINKTNNNSYYAISWSEHNFQTNSFLNKFSDNTNNIWDLKTTGKDVQLSNGANKFSMFAESFNNSSLPYYFKTSKNLAYLQNSVAPVYADRLITGREGVIGADRAEFYFRFGDISVNDNEVPFIEVPQDVEITSYEELNEYLYTEQFDIYDGVRFYYSIVYGLTDSLEAANLLTEGKFVSYSLYLVDSDTEEILAPLDNVIFNQGNISQYCNINYELITEGLGNRAVRMKIVAQNNFEASYSVSQIFSNEEEGALVS